MGIEKTPKNTSRSQSFHSMTIKLAPGEAVELPTFPESREGFLMVSSSSQFRFAFLFYRFSSLTSLQKGSNVDVINDTVLEGDTGEDGVITISASSGVLYFENRREAQVTLYVTNFSPRGFDI